MSETLHGLGCPRCGGMVPVPEGQNLVICPYCGARSVVSSAPLARSKSVAVSAAANAVDDLPAAPLALGSSAAVAATSSAGGKVDGLSMQAIRRYQAPIRVSREAAVESMGKFLGSRFQIARDCAREAQLTEVLMVHLPFWTVWARGVAWGFGQEQVGSGDNKRYEPRERRAAEDLAWNAPACEVSEFGVQRVGLENLPLEPFDAAALHRTGMVFEPVGSAANALEDARAHFETQIKARVKLDRTEQMFTRLINTRVGLVYYPLWVLRYTYRGRAFQVVVNAFDGGVLYGKAPGSVGYRAGVLVGGMAIGAALTIDAPYLIMALDRSSDEDSPFAIAVLAFVFGIAIMYGAYRTFRFGEHYEYHRYKRLGSKDSGLVTMVPGNLRMLRDDVKQAIQTVEKFK